MTLFGAGLAFLVSKPSFWCKISHFEVKPHHFELKSTLFWTRGEPVGGGNPGCMVHGVVGDRNSMFFKEGTRCWWVHPAPATTAQVGQRVHRSRTADRNCSPGFFAFCGKLTTFFGPWTGQKVPNLVEKIINFEANPLLWQGKNGQSPIFGHFRLF